MARALAPPRCAFGRPRPRGSVNGLRVEPQGAAETPAPGIPDRYRFAVRFGVSRETFELLPLPQAWTSYFGAHYCAHFDGCLDD